MFFHRTFQTSHHHNFTTGRNLFDLFSQLFFYHFFVEQIFPLFLYFFNKNNSYCKSLKSSESKSFNNIVNNHLIMYQETTKYEPYRFCLPCDAVENFMKLMLNEFPEVLAFMLDQHEIIHEALKEEGQHCSAVKAVLKAGDICKDAVKRGITDCFKCCEIIDNNLSVIKLIAYGVHCKNPQDELFVENNFLTVKLCEAYFQEFFATFIDKMSGYSARFLPAGNKARLEYHEAKEKYHAVPKIAAQNKVRLEKEKKDLKLSIATTAEKNEKRRAHIEHLTKLHKKRISEGESFKAKAKSVNVQKKNVDDFQTKTIEKEAEMEKMDKLLGVLKQQLLDVKAAGLKEQEARSRERDAKKARIKELSSVVDDLNASIHQKEITLGAKRRNSAAVMKAERDKLQELQLMFLQLRLQNITTSINDFVEARKREIEQMRTYMSMPEVTLEKRNALYENIKMCFYQIDQEKEKLHKFDTVYKQYMVSVKDGTMLEHLPPIQISSGVQRPMSSS